MRLRSFISTWSCLLLSWFHLIVESQSFQIRAASGNDDEPEFVNSSGAGSSHNGGLAPTTKKYSAQNKPVGNAFDHLGGLRSDPHDPRHLTTLLASSASGPVIALVVCSLFMCSFLWFVYSELVAEDETPKFQGPRMRMPSTQPQQSGTVVPRSPTSFLEAQRQAFLSSAPSESSLRTNTQKVGSVGWERSSAAGSEMSGRPGTVALALPALLCADLALPACDTWFAVSLEELESAGNSVQTGVKSKIIPILGLQEQPLLFANVQPGVLTLTVKPGTGCVGQLREIPGGNFHVLDKNTRVYGSYECIGPLSYQMIYGGREQIRLVFDPNTCQMTLWSANEDILAYADKTVDNHQANERLEVCVVAGMDPVLSLLCIVGPMVISPTGHGVF